MIEYNISYKKPWRHFIDFDLKFETNGCEKIILKLASWRPGRYELANYAQYIQKWSAFSINGKRLKFKKIDKDVMKISEGKFNIDFQKQLIDKTRDND